jgi:hypothetical protein
LQAHDSGWDLLPMGVEEAIEKAIFCKKSRQNAIGQQFLIITPAQKLISLKGIYGKQKTIFSNK